MKIKTAELSGAMLDWAVAKCEGIPILPRKRGGSYFTYKQGNVVPVRYSYDWSQGGPLIFRERLQVTPRGEYWCALYMDNLFEDDGSDFVHTGPTPLIAAMRCFVASRLGDEVEVPDELQA